MTTVTPERLALARDAQQLREDGFKYKEIAEILEVSYSYAQALVEDPDGAKAARRKAGYQRPCTNCGILLTGSNGRAAGTGLCGPCHAEASRRWTPDTIVAEFRRFHAETGRPPSTTDAMFESPSVASRMSRKRQEEHARVAAAAARLPDPSTVKQRMGSWKAALAAAGFPPNPTGGASHRGSDTTPKLTGARRDVLQLAADRGRFTFGELRQHRGTTPRNTSALLQGMVRNGYLRRVSRGVYEPV